MRHHSVFASLLVLPVLVGCPKVDTTTEQSDAISAPSSTSLVKEQVSADGNLVVEVDLDGDGQADIHNYYRTAEEGTRLLHRKEVDLNRDGRVDVTSFFTETGELEREEMDSDFDGNVDWIDHYQSGLRVMSEVDTNHNGQYDLFKKYEKRQDRDTTVIRDKERDTNGDGKIDYWEYFDENGQVIKMGWDVDGDGQMDVRKDLTDNL